MDQKEFIQRFKVLCALLRYPPKEENASHIWFGVASIEMTDEQMRTAFERSRDLNEFPSYNEFRELGIFADKACEKNQIDEIVTDIISAYSYQKGIPEDSSPLKKVCPFEIYQAIGGHDRWYRYFSGHSRMPSEKEIKTAVTTYVKKQNQNLLNENRKNIQLEKNEQRKFLK